GESTPAKGGVSQYHVPDDVVEEVLAATNPGQLDVKLRNRLQVALSRSLAKPGIPASLLARWADCKKDRSGVESLRFLQSWVSDTTFGRMVVEETQVNSSTRRDEEEWVWLTRMDLMRDYAALGLRCEEHVEKLVSKAQAKAHPAHPRDPDMRLFRVLGHVAEGRRAQTTLKRGYAITAEVESASQAEFVSAAMGSSEALPAAA
ncbi:MAG: hypothetical protein GY772_21065, partial [bacterium]|nr:hypothetical protein [bacterium]